MSFHIKPVIPVLLTCIASVLLVSCAPVGRSVQRIGTAIHQESAEVDRRVRDMFDAEGLDQGELPKEVEPTYCYRTWGEINCYSQPLAGEEHRFVGKQVPEPKFTEYTYPYPDTKPEPPMAENDSIVFEESPIQSKQVVVDTDPTSSYGGVVYELPESAMRENEQIPAYKKPHELIPGGIE